MRATLNDELLHEAGYEVPLLEARERRRLRSRRWIRHVGVVLGLAVFGAIVAGLEFLRHGGSLGATGTIAGMIAAGLFAVGGLILRVLRDDEESQS